MSHRLTHCKYTLFMDFSKAKIHFLSVWSAVIFVCYLEVKSNILISFPADERPFKCTLCEYKCRSKNNLIGHIRNHTGEKPFHCSECGRAFAMKSTLDQHLAAHSESRYSFI